MFKFNFEGDLSDFRELFKVSPVEDKPKSDGFKNWAECCRFFKHVYGVEWKRNKIQNHVGGKFIKDITRDDILNIKGVRHG